jgi:hypothetical protein
LWQNAPKKRYSRILSPRFIYEIYIKFCVFWYPWSPYCEYKILDLI